MADLGLINEQFTTLNTTFWPTRSAGIVVSGGALHIPVTSAYREIDSAASHSIANSSVSAKFTTFPAQGNGTTQTNMTVSKGNNNVKITRGASGLTVTNTVNGTGTDYSIYPGYATDMAWRVRHNNGWLYVDTSVDGFRWINRWNIASSVDWSTGVQLSFYAWFYGTETLTFSDAVIDWVSIIPDSTGPTPNPRLLDVGEVWDGKLKANWAGEQSAWTYNNSDPDGLRIVQGDAYGRTNVMQFNVVATDVSPKTPTSNPRVQLNGPYLLEPEHVYETSFDMYFPSGTTYTGTWPGSGDRWAQWVQLGYGAPFQGSGPVRLMSRSSTTIGISEIDTQTWSTTLVYDKWIRFVYRQRMSKTRPWYELWYSPDIDGGSPLTNVIPRKKVPTIDYSQDGGEDRVIANIYYSAVLAAGVTKIGPVGFDNFKVTRIQDKQPVL